MYSKVALLLLLSCALTYAGQSQQRTASHSVTIVVEETTQISLEDGLTMTVKQGRVRTAETGYLVRTNSAAPQVIEATGNTEDTALEGVTLRAEMESPDGSGTSMGKKALVSNGNTQTSILLEGLTTARGSGIGLSYEITASPEAELGQHEVEVEYTIREN